MTKMLFTKNKIFAIISLNIDEKVEEKIMKLLFTLNAGVPFPVSGAHSRFVSAPCIEYEQHDLGKSKNRRYMDPISL